MQSVAKISQFLRCVAKAAADVSLDTVAGVVAARLSLARKRLILRLSTRKADAMTVARFPHLAHWGAFTALVEDGRVIGCEPFARDPAPSRMLAAIPAMVHSPLRIKRPAVRKGWRERRERTGADEFFEVSWDTALDLVVSELSRVRGRFGA